MSHYDVLGVRPSADQAAVRRAYLELARRHHPDHAGGDHARMRAINAAWATLGDPARRAAYDEALQGPSPVRQAPSTTRGDAPDPRYDPTDDLSDEEWEALGDDRPVRMTVVLPRWIKLIPLATVVASAIVFWAGAVLQSEPLFALGGMLLLLAGAFFVSAPFVALLGSRRSARGADE